MKYDLLIVGAGLTAATIAARLKHRKRILVLEQRPYVGGNCADWPSGGSFVHRHGPHVFHCPERRTRSLDFLGQFARFLPFRYSVTAEVDDGGEIRRVPFPCCPGTEAVLGREVIDPDEIRRLFFRGYSEKMWGRRWEDLPLAITGRVPVRQASPDYFPGHFACLPVGGYSAMIERMLGGVEVLVGQCPEAWRLVKAERVVWTGRPDLLVPGGTRLTWRSLDVVTLLEDWDLPTVALHCCHAGDHWTRRVWHGAWTGSSACRVVTTEYPVRSWASDLAPCYPVPTDDNRGRYAVVAEEVNDRWPSLILAGRLGRYEYLDMWRAVEDALDLAESLE